VRVLLIAAGLDREDRGNTTTVHRWQRHARHVELTLAPPDPELELATVPDVVHGYHAALAGPAALALARRTGRPLVLSIGGTDLFGDPPPDAFRHAAVVTGAFPAFEAELRARTGSRAIYATVRRAVELPPAASPRPPDGTLRVMLAGGLREVKDPLLAVELAAALRGRGLPIELRIVGPDRSPACAARVRARAAALPYVSFGLAPHDAMGDLYRSCDVVWNTSHSEGGCNVLLEALAHGCAVLGRDVPGNRELLPADCLFDAADLDGIEAFHRARLEEGVAARRQRAAAARRWLAAHHDPDDEANELAAAWTRAADHGGACGSSRSTSA
jgi:glycosyltransferase involved in cell wall biosynthesis